MPSSRSHLEDKDLWKIFRGAYKGEPFMRIVKEASGIHRNPEPKILTGSNYCDVGFERDPHSQPRRRARRRSIT